MAPRVWTCKRVSDGVPCRTVNPRKYQLCRSCGKRRPPTPKPAHMAALDEMTYEQAVALFGERCGICGAEPKPGRKLHRDHEHKGDGRVRGLLCFRCNSALRNYMTADWLRGAADYLERFEVRT